MSVRSKLTLLENAAAGNGSAQTLNSGGKYYFMGEGTFGGGSLKLQFQSPQGTWIDVASSTLSAAGAVALDIPSGQYRAVGATGSAFYAWLIPAI